MIRIAHMSTIWPMDATLEEIKEQSRKHVEVFKMPGGEEYIVHDIDENNMLVGKARFSGYVHVSETISVGDFESLLQLGKNATMNNAPPPSFYPPSFDVTAIGNSHGFDKNGSTSGYVL